MKHVFENLLDEMQEFTRPGDLKDGSGEPRGVLDRLLIANARSRNAGKALFQEWDRLKVDDPVGAAHFYKANVAQMKAFADSQLSPPSADASGLIAGEALFQEWDRLKVDDPVAAAQFYKANVAQMKAFADSQPQTPSL